MADGELSFNKTQAITDILQDCLNAGNWEDLNVQIGLLCTGVSNQVLQAVVQQAVQYIDQAPNDDTKIELITTLTSLTAGVDCLYIERARLIKKLAKIKENQGQINEAANLMKTIMACTYLLAFINFCIFLLFQWVSNSVCVQVEKIKSMDKVEKIIFILEQVRLCLDCHDYEHALRLSRNINPRVFKSGTNEEYANGDRSVVLYHLEKIYYELMIRYHSHMNDYLDVFRCYKAIYEIPFVKEDPGQWMPVLLKMCWYLVLAPYDYVQSALVESTLEDKNLLQLPKCRLLLKRFATMVIIHHEGFMCSTAFGYEFFSELVFLGHSFTQKANEDFEKRVIEHNLRVASKYNRRIELLFLAHLVHGSCEDVERILCEMIDSNSLVAKFHKPKKMVYFPNADDSREAVDAQARLVNDHREYIRSISIDCLDQFRNFRDAALRPMQNQRQFSL